MLIVRPDYVRLWGTFNNTAQMLPDTGVLSHIVDITVFHCRN